MRKFRVLVWAIAAALIGGGIHFSVASSSQAQSSIGSYKVLYRFKGGMDGAGPSELVAMNGMLFGTTVSGGEPCHVQRLQKDTGLGCGTVFEIGRAGIKSIVYRFRGKPDGANPGWAGIIQGVALIALNGKLYGTTHWGGIALKSSGGGRLDAGTVFEVSPAGQERVLYRFRGTPDGANPDAGLVAMNGNLYGTTSWGGTQVRHATGTVFEVSLTGRERVLHRFRGELEDGNFPETSLMAVNGKLYGTTGEGGAESRGTVFEVSPSGKERVLYSFTQNSRLAGESTPSSLVFYNRALVGSLEGFGGNANGQIFAVSLSGRERILHPFRSQTDGASPQGRLVVFDGKLYGTTRIGGGANGKGTVFELDSSGRERVLHRFTGGADGSFPQTGLVVENGMLYGTTQGNDRDPTDHGTVFAISPR